MGNIGMNHESVLQANVLIGGCTVLQRPVNFVLKLLNRCPFILSLYAACARMDLLFGKCWSTAC